MIARTDAISSSRGTCSATRATAASQCASTTAGVDTQPSSTRTARVSRSAFRPTTRLRRRGRLPAAPPTTRHADRPMSSGRFASPLPVGRTRTSPARRRAPAGAGERSAGGGIRPHRQLRDDQRVAPRELTGLAAPGVLASEGAGHVRPGALQRRHQTEQGAGHDRDASTTRAPPEAVRSAVREHQELTAKVTAYGAEIDVIAGSHRKPRSAISLAKRPIRTLTDTAGKA